jgi:hypothetical protein
MLDAVQGIFNAYDILDTGSTLTFLWVELHRLFSHIFIWSHDYHISLVLKLFWVEC